MERITSAALRNQLYATILQYSGTKKAVVVKDKIVTDPFYGFDTRKLKNVNSIVFKNCVFMKSVNFARMPSSVPLSVIDCKFMQSFMILIARNLIISSVVVEQKFEISIFDTLIFEDVVASAIRLFGRYTDSHRLDLTLGKFTANSITLDIDSYHFKDRDPGRFEITACHEEMTHLVHLMLPTVPIRRIYADKGEQI